MTGAGRVAPAEDAVGPPGAVLRDAGLWSAGLAFALALHAGAAWWALRPRDLPPPPAPPPGAILLDLAPLPAAPETPAEDAAPGPAAVDGADAPRPEQTPEARAEPEPVPIPEPEPAPELERRQEAETQAARSLLEAPPAVEPEVAALRPLPRPAGLAPPRAAAPADPEAPRAARPPPAERQAAPRTAAATSSATRPAPEAAAPEEGRARARAQVSPQRWQAQLLAHLERRKRYPREARARGEAGVVDVTFSIDRAGNVTSAGVARSSGVPALDRGALDMLRRASPVPAPPAEVTRLTFTLPVQFEMR
jgi:protein TonB